MQVESKLLEAYFSVYIEDSGDFSTSNRIDDTFWEEASIYQSTIWYIVTAGVKVMVCQGRY